MLLSEDLKMAVLQSALQGQLTKRLLTDSSVDDLLEYIDKERERLIKSKKIKKEKELPLIEDDDKPFDIPDSWKWVYLGEIFMHNAGKALNIKNTKGELKEYITTSNVYEDHFELNNLKKMYYTEDEVERYIIQKNDLLVLEGGDVGRTAIWDLDISYCIQNHIHKLRPYVPTINIRLYFYVLNYFKKIGLLKGKGIAIQGLSSNVLHRVLVPLPPVEEQQRIVDKLDVIMKEIDEYKALEEQANYIQMSFPYDMERAVLQYAMQGKIVKQEESDTNVEVMIDSSKKIKEELIRQKAIKKEKVLEKITEEDIPYEVPSSWRWVRFHQICSLISGCDLTPDKYNSKHQGVPYLTGASNIDDDSKIIINRWVEEPRSIAIKGDLLLTCKGTVGKTAFLEEEQVHIARQIMAVRAYGDVNLEYIHICIKNYVSLLRQKAKSMIPGIDRSTVLNLLIPLPPVEEQQRIVERLEQILPLIDDLKE